MAIKTVNNIDICSHFLSAKISATDLKLVTENFLSSYFRVEIKDYSVGYSIALPCLKHRITELL